MLNRSSILALFLCLITFQAFGATWYAGPSSAGANNGTSEANRWAHSSITWASMSAGDTLNLSVGTYTGISARMNINSTSANYTVTNPLIIEGNNNTLDCQYATTHCLYIKAAAGIRIQNLKVTGGTADNIRLDGSDGTIGLHDVTLSYVTSSAAKQCGIDIDGLAYNVTLSHVISHSNYDSANPGNSDGMCTHFASGAGGSGIVIKDSEFYNNSDDGIDLFQTNNAVTIQRVYSHDNGYSGGDGRGIALGPGNANHVIESSIFTNNDQFGIHRRDNSGVITLRNNTIHDNGTVIAGGKDINFPNTVDLNFPTSQTRFTDSGVNSEYRAISAPVSSLSVGAQSYSAGTVGALAVNQYGYSAPYVYVKGNPGTATVTATPTTQSTAYNNWSERGGLTSDVVTGLTTTATNSWDSSVTAPGFLGNGSSTSAISFKLRSSSNLKRAGTYLNMGNILDYSGKAFLPKPSIGAYEIEEVLDRTAATTRSSRN